MEIERPLVVRAGKPTGLAKATVVQGASGFVFSIGEVGIDPETGVIPKGLEAQTRLAWKNIMMRVK